MKWKILVMVVLVLSLVACGCVKERDSGPATPEVTPTPTEIHNVSDSNASVGGVSQADLDALKEDLERLEYNDITGFSGE